MRLHPAVAGLKGALDDSVPTAVRGAHRRARTVLIRGDEKERGRDWRARLARQIGVGGLYHQKTVRYMAVSKRQSRGILSSKSMAPSSHDVRSSATVPWRRSVISNNVSAARGLLRRLLHTPSRSPGRYVLRGSPFVNRHLLRRCSCKDADTLAWLGCGAGTRLLGCCRLDLNGIPNLIAVLASGARRSLRQAETWAKASYLTQPEEPCDPINSHNLKYSTRGFGAMGLRWPLDSWANAENESPINSFIIVIFSPNSLGSHAVLDLHCAPSLLVYNQPLTRAD